MNKNFLAAIAILVGLTGVITFATTCTLYVCEQADEVAPDTVTHPDVVDETQNVSDWRTYTSDAQGFSFKYPFSYVVHETKHHENKNMRTVSLVQVDKFGNEAPPPAMVINVWVDAGIVEATLWEGGQFKWYEDVLHSFSFNSDKTSF